MINDPHLEFRRAAVEPVECIKAAWELVKPRYWLFLGIVLVGVVIGSAVPLGILMGPMMCGVYLAFFSVRRGQPIEFGTLFKGFDFFGPAVVAALLHTVPVLVLVIPTYIGFYLGMFMTMATQGNEPNPGAMMGFFGVFGFVWLIIIVLIIVLSVLFTFAYPLIVDRKLQGMDAVKLSFKAALANFWRLLGLSVLNALLGCLGILFCIVGVYFVLPITFAATAIAYEQVFGLRDPSQVAANLPPPPPMF